MKRTINYILLLLAAGCMISSCEEADSTFKEFIVTGGLVYPGRATLPVAHSGKYKVLLTWLRGADPTVTNARVYWDNYTDSIDVSISPGQDTIKVLIDDLVEKPYSFQIVTFDKDGNASVPVELLSAAYGDEYQSRMLSRPLNLIVLNVNDTVTLEWGSADIANGAVFTEVRYTDINGETRTDQYPTSEETTLLTTLKPGVGKFIYRTVFLPDSLSIDTFYTEFEESGKFAFDKEDWDIIDFSSEHPGAYNKVWNVIDGTDGTRWHSHSGTSRYPHHVPIDMGGLPTITTVGVWRTTLENGEDKHAPDTILLLTSLNTIN